MSKFVGWESDYETPKIFQDLINKYEDSFRHIDLDKIVFVRNMVKKSKIPYKIHPINYPANIFTNKVYVFEIFDDCWGTLNDSQKNMSILQAIISIPVPAFIESDSKYAKVEKPDFITFKRVINFVGEEPSWWGNSSSENPLGN